MQEIRLMSVDRRQGALVFSYCGIERAEAWIENVNKHYPHILSLDSSFVRREIAVSLQALCEFLARYANQRFRLCFCDGRSRFAYSVCDAVGRALADDPAISVECNGIFFDGRHMEVEARQNAVPDSFSIKHENKSRFRSAGPLPISLLNIGSCFSRSVFKSEEYFNPQYKSHFHVDSTLFHNSYISLLSTPIPFDVSGIEDLNSGDAGKYVRVEFDKGLEAVLQKGGVSLVVSDLYVDASVPVVRMPGNGYLTYNKYISESIFKRHLSSCEVVYPGTRAHGDLLRSSLVAFRRLLEKHGVRNVVLVGGRLSQYRIDEKTGHVALWEDKAGWIAEVNRNWDIVDRMFLQELPDAIYLDKRSTPWLSDINSPILGGASPSHYQSGYYKELLRDLVALI